MTSERFVIAAEQAVRTWLRLDQVDGGTFLLRFEDGGWHIERTLDLRDDPARAVLAQHVEAIDDD